jgi:hypothetical protein
MGDQPVARVQPVWVHDFFLLRIVGVESIRHVGHFWPIVPAPGDCEDGEFGGMMIGRENLNTRRKPPPMPLFQPQIPLDQTRTRTRATAVGGQWLTAWAMARPMFAFNPGCYKVLTSERWQLIQFLFIFVEFLRDTDVFFWSSPTFCLMNFKEFHFFPPLVVLTCVRNAGDVPIVQTHVTDSILLSGAHWYPSGGALWGIRNELFNLSWVDKRIYSLFALFYT